MYRSKRKKNTPIYRNTNYRREIKLVPIIMDDFPHQFDALKFFLLGKSLDPYSQNFLEKVQ